MDYIRDYYRGNTFNILKVYIDFLFKDLYILFKKIISNLNNYYGIYDKIAVYDT